MKKLTPWLLFLLLVISLIPAFNPIVKASPLTWYVSPTGSDSASGNKTHPFKTLQKACNVSSNGDTIDMRGGTYKPPSNTQITGKSGTSWLTIRNYPSETVIINGSNCPTGYYIDAAIELKNSKYIRITGITIDHSALGGIAAWDTTSPCSYIRIDNCTISNSSSFAIKSMSASHISVENNYISNTFCNWNHATEISEESISFETTSYSYIYGNYIKKGHGENIDLKGGCNNCYIHNNKINNTGGYLLKGGVKYYGGTAIYLDARGIEHNISIYNNLVYGNNTGILINNEAATGRLENISIYNNVVNITNTTGHKPTFEGRSGIIIAREGGSKSINKDIKIYMNTVNLGTHNIYDALQIGAYSPSQYMNKNYIRRLKISNNIFTTKTGVGHYILQIYGLNSTDGVTYISLNNNLFNNSYAGAHPYIGWKEDSYYYSSPTKWGNNPKFTRPRYKTVLPYNPHLNASSPCINTATSSLVASVDYNGKIRPQGAGYDIGAFEASVNLPPIFGTPSPTNGSTENPLNLTWSLPINDPEGNTFTWTIQCNNGQKNNGTGATNGTKTLTLSCLAYSKTYKVWVNATDPGGSGLYNRRWYSFNTTNHPPNKPKKPTGPTTRVTGQQGTYWANGTDPDGDKIQYLFDWNASGSHSYSAWTSLVNSGTPLSKSHAWTKAGTYVVKVQSRDEHGATSVWSTGLTVIVSA